MGGFLIFGLIAGVICAIIAANKGRNAVGWFLFGFFFGLIPIIVISVISNLKEERARYQRAHSERRRLREELKMERMRAQQFEARAARRLDIHDRALGIETGRGQLPPVAPGGAAGQISGPSAPKQSSWYYAPDGQEAVGPMSFAEFGDAFRAGRFTPNDLVWKSGWKDWRPLGDVDGLEDALRK